jgi:7,8-dihydro-6-hydroxymethylpterin-pyrophosphokinase
VIAIGANLGDRQATMTAALEELARLPLTTRVVASAPIETVALTLDGPDAEAPAYLNAVALVTTASPPPCWATSTPSRRRTGPATPGR